MIVTKERPAKFELKAGHKLKLVGGSTCTATVDRFDVDNKWLDSTSITAGLIVTIGEFLQDCNFTISSIDGSVDYVISDENQTNSAIVTTTWANRATAISSIAALTPSNGWVFVTDVGLNGTMMWCNGVSLLPVPVNIIQKAKGWIVPSLAAANASTYSQSGNTITVVNGGGTPAAHTIPATKNGCDIYLAMGVAATGATIPAGWFSNFTWVDANTFTCVSTTSQTGTGAVNTNLAETVISELTTTIQGGLLGLNGKLSDECQISGTGSANNKRVYGKFGGASGIFKNQILAGASNVSFSAINSFSNENSLAKQVGPNAFALVGGGANTNATEYHTINSANDVSLTHSILIAAANEYLSLDYINVTIQPTL